MRKKKLIAIAVVLVAFVTMLLLWRTVSTVAPPVITVVGVESASMLDSQLGDMWLVTLKISNPDRGPGGGLYFDDAAKPLEAKVGERWTSFDGPVTKLGFHALAPGGKFPALLVLPTRTEVCRIPLKWTASVLKKGRAAWLLQGLPARLRSRISNRIWRWAGYIQYGPATHWKEANIEVRLPADAVRTELD